jgi:sec-independent protein translocase protein TatB
MPNGRLKFRSARTECCRVARYALPHYDDSMSFSDTIFLFFLALILFGPKKLPEMARQAGKLLNELRRASNEFKSQIETEIAHLEVKNQAAQPASPPPQGTIASLSVNPAMSESIPHEPEAAATLAAPSAKPGPPVKTAADITSPAPSNEALSEAGDAASQASHV